MSQIETLMLLALGCSATLLVVLLFGRGIWSLLGRWSGWQQARNTPRVVRELQAERDGLKAETAMMARKLDMSVSDMKMRLAEQMAEVSRNRNRLLDANAKLANQSELISRLQNEIVERETKISGLNSQIEDNVKAIASAWARTAENEGDVSRATAMHKEALSAVTIREERIRYLESEARTLRQAIATAKPEGSSEFNSLLPGVAHHEAMAISKSAHPQLDNLTQAAMLPPVSISSGEEPPENLFQSRLRKLSGNPFTPAFGESDSKAASQHLSDAPSTQVSDNENFGSNIFSALENGDEDELEKGTSNVLSLAERVRVLQRGMKK